MAGKICFFASSKRPSKPKKTTRSVTWCEIGEDFRSGIWYAKAGSAAELAAEFGSGFRV
jgi:hypothetical protein